MIQKNSRFRPDDSRFTTTASRRFIIILPVFLAGCMAGSVETSVGPERISVPAVYARYLTFPVPSHGIDAEFNPPVLRWPVQKGSAITYDMRLSMDSLFEGEGTIEREALAWAMFNPHQRLSEGTWFWQYRRTGSEWSATERFRITKDAPDLVSPPAARFLKGIPSEHPRVLAEKSVVAQLRTRSSGADKEAILKEVFEAMRRKMPTEEDGKPQREGEDDARNRKFAQDASQRLGDFVYRNVVPLCQAYLLTGNSLFKDRALSIASKVATWNPAGVTGSGVSDFADARCMLAMAIAFDTFYEHMSPAQRKTLLKAIHARADGFYQSWVNNQEARVLSGHVWQHILHYFFQTALAVYGHHPDADTWLSYAYELFLARAPILGGADGGWIEGVSYFRMNMETVIEIPLFINKYTGFDFINTHPWYVENIDWLIYHIPPGSSADGFGDNTEEIFSPGGEYIAFASELAKLTGNGRASWYARQCARYEQPDLSSIPTLRWIRLTRTNSLPMPAAEQIFELPTGRVFRDVGLMSMQSHPENTAENLMVAMRSSPFGSYGHFLSDQNAFNILYGGKRTFFRTGYKVTMQDPHRTRWYQHTKSNNSILVDGAGQPYSTEAFGWIPRFITGKDLAYAQADGSNAYRSIETDEDYGVTKFYRHLILLKPDVVVIYDELESERDVNWSWLIHSMEKMEVKASENSFESVFDHSRGIGKLWSSDPVKWALADTFEVPAVNWRNSRDASGNLKTYDDDQWHLQAVSKTKNSRMRFLAVLRFAPDTVRGDITSDLEGALLNASAGGWRISASLDPAQLPFLTAKNDAGTVLIYDGTKDPVLVEVNRGKEIRTEGRQVVPWYLQQSWLHYGNNRKQIQRND